MNMHQGRGLARAGNQDRKGNMRSDKQKKKTRVSQQSADSKYGVVRWFDEKRGYGFIKVSGGESNIFVHHTNVMGVGLGSLAEGDKVEFDIEITKKGPQARNVRVKA